MKSGGYKIIDLEGRLIDESLGGHLDGIYDKVEKSYGSNKATLVSGVNKDGNKIEDFYTKFVLRNNIFYGLISIENNEALYLKVEQDDDISIITETFGEGGGEQYTLPVASANTLGGVKIGNGISVDSDGTINVTGGGEQYTLPVASANTLGGVKIGNGISVDSDGTINVTGGGGGTGDGVQIIDLSVLGEEIEDHEINVNVTQKAKYVEFFGRKVLSSDIASQFMSLSEDKPVFVKGYIKLSGSIDMANEFGQSDSVIANFTPTKVTIVHSGDTFPGISFVVPVTVRQFDSDENYYYDTILLSIGIWHDDYDVITVRGVAPRHYF